MSRIRRDRELASDAMVLSWSGEDKKAYGQTIIHLLENMSRPAVCPGVIGILEDKECSSVSAELPVSIQEGVLVPRNVEVFYTSSGSWKQRIFQPFIIERGPFLPVFPRIFPASYRVGGLPAC